MSIWTGLLEALGQVLRLFHNATVGLFGGYSWAVAIVLLTLLVRLALMPLAIRQFRSMQAMQKLRPEMKKIQTKYKADRSMMRTDPEKYRERRQKQQEELMALYKEHNVNPASSCLPLVAQMPIFIALFSVLRSPDVIPELVNAPFPIGATLQMPASQAGVVALAMLVAMGITTFVQQKQMMGRQVVGVDDQQMQQQKMMMYIMPVFLIFLGFNLPVGVLVYWVTTNLLQMAQQWYMLREVGGDGDGDGNGNGDGNGAGGAKGARARSTGGKGNAKGAGSAGGKGNAKGAGSTGGKGNAKGAGSTGAKGAAKRAGTGGAKGAGSRKPRTGKDKRDVGRNGTQGNGHRPGGPGRLGRKRDETRDKRP